MKFVFSKKCCPVLTPEGFPNKAKGCAYPRYPGKGCVYSRYPGKGQHKMHNPGGVAYSLARAVLNGQPFQG